MQKLYYVFDGLSGYMPDTVNCFTNKRSALAFMASEARDLRDSGYTVSGNATYGYTYGFGSEQPYSLNWDCEYFVSRECRDEKLNECQW